LTKLTINKKNMSFIQRIFKTKKIKEAKKIIKKTGKNIAEEAKELAQKADEKFDLSEKLDDLKEGAENILDEAKEKIGEVDKKFEVSKKAEEIANKTSELAEKAGNKIESVLDEKISFDTFAKVEIKVGEILEAEPVKKSEKLLKLKVDFGGRDQRQIISGIAKSYSPEEIIGKKATFVTNLEPRKIMGLESNGMILGVSNKKTFSILSPEKDEIEAGAKAS
jgi:methionyl-tRNA synthetase